MKTDSQRDDFMIEEISNLPLVPRGLYGVYRLEKEGWSTLTLLVELAKRLRLPLESISYGGRLERDAKTTQHIAIEHKKIDDLVMRNYRLTFAGWMDRPMGPDLVKANRFELILRGLSPAQAQCAVHESAAVRLYGFANYFDDSRLGLYDPLQGFFAEKVLKGHFNGAAKIYLTAPGRGDTEEDRARKLRLVEHWKDWKTCLSLSQTPSEKSSFHYLMRKPDDFLGFLYEIPREEVLALFNSYQAFIWNETLRRLIRSHIGPQTLKSHAGTAGDYLFYDALNASDCLYFSKLSLPTLSAKMEMPDALTRKISDVILNEQGIEKSLFNKTKYRKIFFKSSSREAIAIPEDLSLEPETDDSQPNMKALKLQARLPFGAHVGLLVKRLMATGATQGSVN